MARLSFSLVFSDVVGVFGLIHPLSDSLHRFVMWSITFFRWELECEEVTNRRLFCYMSIKYVKFILTFPLFLEPTWVSYDFALNYRIQPQMFACGVSLANLRKKWKNDCEHDISPRNFDDTIWHVFEVKAYYVQWLWIHRKALQHVCLANKLCFPEIES